jgi:hypothetical protein
MPTVEGCEPTLGPPGRPLSGPGSTFALPGDSAKRLCPLPEHGPSTGEEKRTLGLH